MGRSCFYCMLCDQKVFHITPYGGLDGKEAITSTSSSFGCEAYSHVPMKNRLKLDRKELKCIFINYVTSVKGLVSFRILCISHDNTKLVPNSIAIETRER